MGIKKGILVALLTAGLLIGACVSTPVDVGQPKIRITREQNRTETLETWTNMEDVDLSDMHLIGWCCYNDHSRYFFVIDRYRYCYMIQGLGDKIQIKSSGCPDEFGSNWETLPGQCWDTNL